MNYNKIYYIKNKYKYKKGGKYYSYKPKEYPGKIKIKKGFFLLYFN